LNKELYFCSDKPGKIRIIAAMSRNRIIGIKNDLPWRIPEDLKRFKKLTRESVVVMGRKTFESMGGRPLPDRLNIIISRDFSYKDRVPLGCLMFSNFEVALSFAKHRDVWIIGGAQIYRMALKYADEIHLTIIDGDYKGDVKFPRLNKRKWRLACRQEATSIKYKGRFYYLTFGSRRRGKNKELTIYL